MKTIYALQDPDTNEVKYVGQSLDPEKRLEGHLRISHHCPMSVWIAGLKQADKLPVILHLEQVPVGEHCESERFWIEYLASLGAKLYNKMHNGHKTVGIHERNRYFRQRFGGRYVKAEGMSAVRRNKGLSFDELAYWTGISASSLRFYEYGDGAMVSATDVAKIAAALGCPVENIVHLHPEAVELKNAANRARTVLEDVLRTASLDRIEGLIELLKDAIPMKIEKLKEEV